MSTSILSELPDEITIVEVGPRDGLQNQATRVPTEVKVRFIEDLADAGLPVVEATSFVDPRWVPQLDDASEVMRKITRHEGTRYPVLVPNEKGLDLALEAEAREVSIFASATESFSKRNLNRTRDEATEMFRPVARRALDAGLKLRGYLSMVLGDPWEGPVDVQEVVAQCSRLFELGCTEVSLGDTIGVGTARKVQELLTALIDSGIPISQLAVHFHDTYGQGLANVLAALSMGVTVVDSSAGGLGGCPFAKSATGNLATEDLVWMCDGLGIKTGVDVTKVAAAAARLAEASGIELPGRAARALST